MRRHVFVCNKLQRLSAGDWSNSAHDLLYMYMNESLTLSQTESSAYLFIFYNLTIKRTIWEEKKRRADYAKKEWEFCCLFAVESVSTGHSDNEFGVQTSRMQSHHWLFILVMFWFRFMNENKILSLYSIIKENSIASK